MWPFKRPVQSAAQRRSSFWKWIVAHEEELATITTGHEPIAERLATELHRVHPGLMWQVGPPNERSKRELTISADGVREVFDEVEALCEAAPQLRLFRVQRFRPPVPGCKTKGVRFRGRQLQVADVSFIPYNGENGLIDLLVFVPGSPTPADEPTLHLVFLMLDMVVGEYDVTCRLGAIEVLPAESDLEPLRGVPRFPLHLLPSILNEENEAPDAG